MNLWWHDYLISFGLQHQIETLQRGSSFYNCKSVATESNSEFVSNVFLK